MAELSPHLLPLRSDPDACTSHPRSRTLQAKINRVYKYRTKLFRSIELANEDDECVGLDVKIARAISVILTEVAEALEDNVR